MTELYFNDIINCVDRTKRSVRTVVMNEHNINHNLIEYILTVSEASDDKITDNEIETAEYKNTCEIYPEESRDIKTAYEVRDFMDEMPGGFLIYHADENEEIIYVNKALLRIFGCEDVNEFKELTGNSFSGLVHPEDLEDVQKSINKQISLSQYDLDYVEYRIIRKDGEIRWIEDYGHFIRSELGGIFYVFIFDATEKKLRQIAEKEALISEKEKREQKLQRLIDEYDKELKVINQEHLRRLEIIECLSVNYECILYADLDTNKIFPYRLSGRTERQFGKKFETLDFDWYTQDYINTWLHPDDREEFTRVTDLDYIRRKLAENETYYVNYRAVQNDEIQYLQLRFVDVKKAGPVSQVVMGYRRVDDEVKAEMEQKKVLENALNTAKIANIAKNTFLSNMSHDMRTPLNAIMGFTSLAKKNANDPEKILYYLNRIETASDQLLRLINNVLEISWIESGKMHIAEDECNIKDIVLDVHESMVQRAEKKGIEFNADFDSVKHSDVYSDKEKLKQILHYLSSNAITYTDSGGIVNIIVTELENLLNGYAVYQFVVEDNGIGISKEFHQRIFEPFQREKNTTLSGVLGTGLGLAIVKNIVELMGGKVEVDSAVGKGSRFTVTLSLKIYDEQKVSLKKSEEDVSIHSKVKKILLVEDNELNLEIEMELLKDMGFQIDTAANGSIALEKVRNSNPGDYDLILMDIQMPVMNGHEAAREIRRIEDSALANIPIVAVSANTFESDKKISIENGMNGHIAKPFSIDQLIKTVSKLI